LEKAGLEKEAIDKEIELADKLLKTDQQNQAWDHLKHVIDRLAESDCFDTDDYK